MTKQEILKQVCEHNQKFTESMPIDFFLGYQQRQTPRITLVSCSDSRVQIKAIVENSVNKIFSVRNIGNQIYNSEGSVDYGVLTLKTPILLIMGHTDCGAIKAFCQGYDSEPESIKQELNSLIPAISKNKTSVLQKIIQNIHYQTGIATKKYHTLVNNDHLLIVGALYDFKNKLKKGYGKLHILNINGALQS